MSTLSELGHLSGALDVPVSAVSWNGNGQDYTHELGGSFFSESLLNLIYTLGTLSQLWLENYKTKEEEVDSILQSQRNLEKCILIER